MSDGVKTDDLEEGSLYVFKKGVLQEVRIDPDDLMKRIKITDDAFFEASELQSKMRKAMSGYRPDINTICSALVKHSAVLPDAVSIVQKFTLEIYQNIGEAH